MEAPRVFRTSSHVVLVAPLKGQPNRYAFRWVAIDPVASRTHFEQVVDRTEAEFLVHQMEGSPAFAQS